MQKIGKSVVVVTVLLMLILSTVAATGKSEATVSGEAKQKVMLYSSLKDSQLAAIKEGFSKKYPHVTMDYYTAGTGNVMTKLATEQ